MPWKKDYTFSDETSPVGVTWPQGKAAVTLVIDYSVPAGPGGIDEAAIAYAASIWGNAVQGDWLVDALDACALKATFAVPLAMAQAFPGSVRRAFERGHEIAAGSYAKEDVARLTPAEEQGRMERTFSELADLTGARPEGWYALPRTRDDWPGGSLSPFTLDLLAGYGCGYFGNSMADDIPHYCVLDEEGPRTLLALPYYYAHDAQFFVFFPGIGRGSGLMRTRDLWENWSAELAGAAAYGRQATLIMQPYLMQSGPARKVLADLAAALKEGPYWTATASECAAYWRGAYPAERTLHLEKAAWPD